MPIEDRLTAFATLGEHIKNLSKESIEELAVRVSSENPWFTSESVQRSLAGLNNYLDKEKLKSWVSQYQLPSESNKTVAIIMAGNIPLAGFHDFLAVIISGHLAQVKLSSKDSILLPFLVSKLLEIEPRLKRKIEFVERLKDFDAVIATGSDNSARYFHYYFGKYPHIIRKNRTSCAVLRGNESKKELALLGNDIFTYYGLGCRNVSKLYLPKGYNIQPLLEAWKPFERVMHHHKYHNNYDYQKSILLINQIAFYDSSFVLLQENEKLVSPISVVYYEQYENEQDLALKLAVSSEKIQCIVGNKNHWIPFGQAQSPELWDYADQVDTLNFLQRLD